MKPIHVLRKVAGTLRTIFISLVRVSLAQLMSLCHANINYILGAGVNITELQIPPSFSMHLVPNICV